jgi:hypothetical protein
VGLGGHSLRLAWPPVRCSAPACTREQLGTRFNEPAAFLTSVGMLVWLSARGGQGGPFWAAGTAGLDRAHACDPALPSG